MTTAQYPHNSLTLAALTLNLRRLCWIRAIVLVFMSAALLYGYRYLGIESQLFAVAIVIAIQGLITSLTYLRLRSNRVVSETEFSTQLIIDVLFIFALAYFTGGATNPFISYFLVPLSIAAATLPKKYAAAIAGLSVVAYSILLFTYQPLAFFSHTTASSTAMDHSQHLSHAVSNSANSNIDISAILNPHYLGMWFNFLVSAVLIAWFVSRMAEALRAQENAINQQREQQLYDEQILSIATLAAGTAHELGTPINSLSLLVEEMASEAAQSQHQQEDLALMQSQILQCRNSLKKLVHTAQQTQPGEKFSIHVTALVNACIEHWHPLRPEVTVNNLFINRTINAVIHCDESLSQALTNLLNNAANASPDSVAIDIQQHDDIVHIIVSNKGKSIPDNILRQFNRQPLHNRRDQNSTGLGFGLFLSNASIHRHGGLLLLRNLESGGAEAIIQLPLITAEQEAIND